MGWPGIDFEELAELNYYATGGTSVVDAAKQAVSVAQEHLAVAYSKLEALHKRCGYAVVRDVMIEIETAGEVLRGSS